LAAAVMEPVRGGVLALSGMSTKQAEENVASAGRSGPGTLSAEELELIGRARDRNRQLAPIPCPQCGHCQPPTGQPGQHPAYLGALQRGDNVRRRGSVAAAEWLTQGGEVAGRLHRVWRVPGKMPAAHRDPGLDGEGARAAGFAPGL